MKKAFGSSRAAKVRLVALLLSAALIPSGILVLARNAHAQQIAGADILTFAPVDVWTGTAQAGPHQVLGTMFLPAVQNGVYHVDLITNYGTATMAFGADGENQGFYVYYETPPERKTWLLHLQRFGSNEEQVLTMPADIFDVLATIRIRPATTPNGREVRAESAGLEVEGYPEVGATGTGWVVTTMSPLQGR